jgi:hypothetical protein
MRQNKNTIMKKLFLLLSIPVLLSTACTKQKGLDDNPVSHNNSAFEDNPNGGGGNNTTSVPMAVLSAFNTRYPDATRIEWKKLSDGSFKAEFFRGSVRWQAIFTAAGNLVKEERD